MATYDRTIGPHSSTLDRDSHRTTTTIRSGSYWSLTNTLTPVVNFSTDRDSSLTLVTSHTEISRLGVSTKPSYTHNPMAPHSTSSINVTSQTPSDAGFVANATHDDVAETRAD